MLYALFADIHANREALTSCMEHAAAQGAQRQVFLGDMVGYGADPGWVVDTIAERVEEGALAVFGNHDEAVAQTPRQIMHDNARVIVDWTRASLNPKQLAFLAGLPLQIDEGDCLFVHANAYAPAYWDYIDGILEAARSMQATRARFTFCGHVHEPALYHLGASGRAGSFLPTPGTAIPLSRMRRWLALPGSVGQPRDGNPAACYGLFDSTNAILTYFRIPYDCAAAARKMRAAGLPERMALRLEFGE